MPTLGQLKPGVVYSWKDLSEALQCEEDYFGSAGGMISRPSLNVLAIVTHPKGGKSFDYGDRWEDGDLIYTGRGQTGDQKLEGQNRDLALNARTTHVLEGAGPRQLRYLGIAQCIGEPWRERALDKNKSERDVLRFRLRFSLGGSVASSPATQTTPQALQPRAFDPSLSPTLPSPSSLPLSPEAADKKKEKATTEHHQLLVQLHDLLVARGWSDICEIPFAVDLMASKDGTRVLFEAKSITADNELTQTRSALSQLLEYRYVLNAPTDTLCLVVNRALHSWRVEFLNAMGVHVLVLDAAGAVAAGKPLPGV